MIGGLRLPWYAAVSIIAAVLILIAVGVAYLDASRTEQPIDWGIWRVILQNPAITVYILGMYPVVLRTQDRATRAILQLVPLDRTITDQLIKKYSHPKHKQELATVFIGIVLIVMLAQPWNGIRYWLDLYLLITELIMFGLLALIIYHGMRSSRYLTRLIQNLDLDVFNVNALAPVARWSLTIFLVFIGGIALSIVFQTIENLIQWQAIAIYCILIAAAILIFFMSIWNTHTAIVAVKKRELNLVTGKLTEAWHQMKEQSQANINEISNLRADVAAWGVYDRRLREVKEWPLSTGLVGRLAISAISPGIVYLLRLVFGSKLGL